MTAHSLMERLSNVNESLSRLCSMQSVDELAAETLQTCAEFLGASENLCCFIQGGPTSSLYHTGHLSQEGVFLNQPEALPSFFQAALNTKGRTLNASIRPEELGVKTGQALSSVHGVCINPEDGLSCWIGFAKNDRSTSEQDFILLELYGQHVGAVFQRICAESKRRDLEFQYRTIVEQIPAVVYYRDFEKPGLPSFVSPQIESIFGITQKQYLDNPHSLADMLHPDDKEWVLNGQSEYRPWNHQKPISVRYRIVLHDGEIRWVENHALALRDEVGAPKYVIGLLFDATEKKQLEEQLRQSQKLKAVGQLAGGIAHDFNNLLAVILGYGEMILGFMEPDDPNRQDLLAMISAGERGAHLVKQLLTFSRKQVVHPVVLRVDKVVDEMRSMVSRLLNAQIAFNVDADGGSGSARIDRGQLEQIIMNLVINARDAMPEGGQLNVSIRNVTLDEIAAQTEPFAEPGEYIMLAVSDTGCGMSHETKQRIFEPFFTTKNVGQGTGLGLSTVMGIVKQNNGSLWVYSELGKGSTFKVYLPRTAGPHSTRPESSVEVEAIGGTERVLVVEDDGPLRALLVKLLSSQGYTVFSAPNGRLARDTYETHKPLDVLITDVIMPHVGGLSLARELKEIDPNLAVVYMSGYTGENYDSSQLLNEDVLLLNKPFTVPELMIVLRKAIERRTRPEDSRQPQ